ncbi:hypothetical protein [Nostoc sp. NZL]|uniref:hypothetical protein n=1 Tax=Nostoc sp. NZL TaxID=2650612 RepID=UPI0018C5EAD0|nr:hypothetical protein [Nostoc sp. NZL]MBG1240243.1 hypothetical protein [Nostoc sp. NZL]
MSTFILAAFLVSFLSVSGYAAITEHTEVLQIIDKFLNPNYEEEGIVTIESIPVTSNGKTELEALREELRILKSAEEV